VTVQLKIFPRPLERIHSERVEPHAAHIVRGRCRQRSQSLQRWKRSSPRAHQA
jgi:hypothetical protein